MFYSSSSTSSSNCFSRLVGRLGRDGRRAEFGPLVGFTFGLGFSNSSNSASVKRSL